MIGSTAFAKTAIKNGGHKKLARAGQNSKFLSELASSTYAGFVKFNDNTRADLKVILGHDEQDARWMTDYGITPGEKLVRGTWRLNGGKSGAGNAYATVKDSMLYLALTHNNAKAEAIVIGMPFPVEAIKPGSTSKDLPYILVGKEIPENKGHLGMGTINEYRPDVLAGIRYLQLKRQ